MHESHIMHDHLNTRAKKKLCTRGTLKSPQCCDHPPGFVRCVLIVGALSGAAEECSRLRAPSGPKTLRDVCAAEDLPPCTSKCVLGCTRASHWKVCVVWRQFVSEIMSTRQETHGLDKSGSHILVVVDAGCWSRRPVCILM